MADNLRQRLRDAIRDAGSGPTVNGAADAALTVMVPLITELPAVNLADPCVECREPFEPGDRVSWRLRYLPQGLIHEECR